MTSSSIASEVARAHSGQTFDHLNDLLVNALRTYGDRVLLHSADDVTYSGLEIEHEIARFAAALKKKGVSQGVRVAVLAGNGVAVLFAQQAIGVLGGVYTALHPLGSPTDFAYIIGDSEIGIVIVDKSRQEEIEKAVVVANRSVQVLTFGGGGRNDLIVLAAQEDATRISLQPIDPEAVCRIIYTGGTTGVPKAS